MSEEYTNQKILLNELKNLQEICNINTTELASFLANFLIIDGTIDHADDDNIEKLHSRLRKQLTSPPKNLSIIKKYIKILKEHHPNLKGHLILPKTEPEFDNEIDQLRFDKMMEKINNMDK